jgi:hypothetical protein
MRAAKYWIVVVSKEHMQWGVEGGFIQVNHGKEAPLKRMQINDWIIIYSPSDSLGSKTKVQAFTAAGTVSDEKIYEFKMSETFIPYRRNINFKDSKEVSILPLIENLEFIKNKKSWGFPFRIGFFEVNENDFKLIISKMLKDENNR